MSLKALLIPFVRAFNGVEWHDTFVVVLPPLGNSYVPLEYYGGYKPALMYYIYVGDVREYDPSTGSVGAAIRTPDAGFIHEHPDYMRLHVDPFVESFIAERPYEFVAWLSPAKPHRLLMFNRTNKFIWLDVTIWIAEFPSEEVEYDGKKARLEDLFKMYMQGIASIYINEVMKKLGK